MFTDCIHYTVVFVLQSNLAGWSALPINEYGLALHLQCELSCSLSLGFFLSFFFLRFFSLSFFNICNLVLLSVLESLTFLSSSFSSQAEH